MPPPPLGLNRVNHYFSQSKFVKIVTYIALLKFNSSLTVSWAHDVYGPF